MSKQDSNEITPKNLRSNDDLNRKKITKRTGP